MDATQDDLGNDDGASQAPDQSGDSDEAAGRQQRRRRRGRAASPEAESPRSPVPEARRAGVTRTHGVPPGVGAGGRLPWSGAPRPLRLRRPHHRLARPRSAGGPRDPDRDRDGRRGGHHRLVRRDRRRRARPRHGHARGPARQAAHVPARRRLPARGHAGDPRPPGRGRGPAAPTRTASGSVAVPGTKARVARASRIFVEGRHDAELVEKVWGDDLRVEGVVVEYLEGVDDLAEHLRDFRPGPQRRVGVLVDHLVAGSKESRIAPGLAQLPGRPARADRRPPVRRHLAGGQARPARHQGAGRTSPAASTGRRASASSWAGRTATRPTSPGPGSTSSAGSRSYADLEPRLLGRVEELIDFVTAP